MPFERLNKYVVIKMEDMAKYLSREDRIQLGIVLATLESGRKRDGKTPNSYVVVNEDEPYAEAVWEMIEKSQESISPLSPGKGGDAL